MKGDSAFLNWDISEFFKQKLAAPPSFRTAKKFFEFFCALSTYLIKTKIIVKDKTA